MLNRACAVSLFTVASLVACAGAAAPASSSPGSLISSASTSAQKGHWDDFLSCFTPEARKQLMVSLAKPVFAAASANDDLESELDRRLSSLGASRSTILSGKDLSRQTRFVELLVDFAGQNDIGIASYWTSPESFRLNSQQTIAYFESSQQNGVPTSFSVVKIDGLYRLDMQANNGNSDHMATASNANNQVSENGSWIAPGLFPSLREALSAMKTALPYTPDAAWSAGVPSSHPDLNPGQTVLASFPAPNGSSVHVCMLLGLEDGRARLLTADGTLVEGVPGALVSPIDSLDQHIGRGPQTGESVLAFRKDGASFFGTIRGFEHGAPIVAYYDRDLGATQSGAMSAVVPVNQKQCVMYQMVAFECAGGVETGLCVAQTDGFLWLITSGGLTPTSHDDAQLLAWTGTDTNAGLEQFRGVSGNRLASADLLGTSANLELEIMPNLMPFPAYAVGGVDTDNDN